MERKVSPLAREIRETDRDHEIRKRDQSVRKHVKPDYFRSPEIAHAVGHEVGNN